MDPRLYEEIEDARRSLLFLEEALDDSEQEEISERIRMAVTDIKSRIKEMEEELEEDRRGTD